MLFGSTLMLKSVQVAHGKSHCMDKCGTARSVGAIIDTGEELIDIDHLLAKRCSYDYPVPSHRSSTAV